MTNEKAIEIMQDMKNHAERTDDKELMDACDTAIKALEQKKKTGWISVSEGLPEEYQRVLVTIVNYNGDKVVRVAEYHDRKRFFQIKENHEQWEVGEKGLLAWMPLPKPYKDGDTDGNS